MRFRNESGEQCGMIFEIFYVFPRLLQIIIFNNLCMKDYRDYNLNNLQKAANFLKFASSNLTEKKNFQKIS